jgi:hypothetical protein
MLSLCIISHCYRSYKTPKNDKGENEDNSSVCVCIRPPKQVWVRHIKTEQWRCYSTFCTICNFTCRPLILILQRLAESSEHCECKAVYFFPFFFFAPKGFKKVVKTTIGSACVYESLVLIRPQESRIKFALMKLFNLKNDQIIFSLIWSRLPGYHEHVNMT